ncbi:MAG: enoyl-CoA hydratase [Acidimicrobiales bacterium]|jgi:enoyl-CoA hydratase
MSTVDAERHDTSVVVTLNNPDAFNALAPNMTNDLVEALRAAAADRSCRSIILTGAGQNAFCAGIDVKSVAAKDALAAADSDERLDPVAQGFENLHHHLSSMIRTIHTLPIPVISAVNGHAIGVGFALAAASDLRVAGDNAKFADGFIRRGISGCELGLSYFLPKLVGASLAFDWMLTGRRVEADEASRSGFIGQVVDPADTVDTALALGRSIAELAPMAVSMTKEVMWSNLHAASLDQALALEGRTQAMTRTTADAAEARLSFLEKRPPVFKEPSNPRIVR